MLCRSKKVFKSCNLNKFELPICIGVLERESDKNDRNCLKATFELCVWDIFSIALFFWSSSFRRFSITLLP